MRLVTGSAQAAAQACEPAGEPVAYSGDDIEVTACPHGPFLVRGADAVRDADGELHPTTRPVVAVCACDKSQRMPWCDGTHKVLRRRS